MASLYDQFINWKKKKEEEEKKKSQGFIGPVKPTLSVKSSPYANGQAPTIKVVSSPYANGQAPSVKVVQPAVQPKINMAKPVVQPRINPVALPIDNRPINVTGAPPKRIPSALDRAKEIADYTNKSTGQILKEKYGDNWKTKTAGVVFGLVDPIAKTISTTRISNRIQDDVIKGKVDPSVYDMMDDMKKSNLQVLGDAIQVGTLFAPVGFTRGIGLSGSKILAQQGLKKGLLELAKIGVKEGSLQGMSTGIGAALSSGSRDPKEIAKIIAINTGVGAAAQGVLTPVLPLAGVGIKAGANKITNVVSDIIANINKLHDDQITALIQAGVAPARAKMLIKESGFLRTARPPKVIALEEKWQEMGLLLERTGNKNTQKTIIKARAEIEKQLNKELRDFYEGGYIKFGKDIADSTGETLGKQKERGFLKSVKESPQISSATKEAVDQLPDSSRMYDVATDKAALAKAQAETDDALTRKIFSNDKPDKDTVVGGLELMRRYRKAGNTQGEIDVVEKLAPELTRAGQTVQAASMLDKLSPDGVLLYAQRQIDKVNKNKILPQYRKKDILTPDVADKLKDLATRSEEATDPVIKGELKQQLRSALSLLTRSSLGKKVATTQTMAQLLNPKTMVRNTIGNEIFWRLERINKYVATPIDWTRSKLTGSNRTVTFRTGKLNHWGDYFQGLSQGVKSGFKGQNTLVTQADFTPGLAFTSKWNPLSWFERTMKAGLQGFDQASYNRARNATIGEMAYLKALNEGKKGAALKSAALQYSKNVDSNILEMADNYGKYATYQDNNLISKGLVKVKRGLNLGKDFGVGDMVVKYPRTPGAILMRGLEYSPAGFLKSAYELIQPWLRGGTPDPRAVTEALSRAITGSVGLTGMGYVLADLGIITGKREEDKDISAAESKQGLNKYQVNLSALKRFALSGFNKDEAKLKPGDTMYSYDWAQPVAIMIAIGANANKNVKEGKGVSAEQGALGAVTDSFIGGVETFAEQPVVAGIARIIGNKAGFTDTLKDIAKQTPASFAPTAGSQVNQYLDNNVKSTYDPSLTQEAWNKVRAKIPIYSKGLPTTRDVFGEEVKRYQNGNNTLINVFLNPGFVKKYQEDPNLKMVMDIFSATGETKQAPRVVPTSQQISKDGESTSIKISPKEQEALQIVVGKITKQAFDRISKNPTFLKLSPEEQADTLAEILGDINQAAKMEIINHTPNMRGVSKRAQSYIRDMKKDPELSKYLFTPTKIK